MTYQEFFKALGNLNPICLIDNKIKISVNEINKYNKKNDIYFIPNIGGTKSKDITDFKAFFSAFIYINADFNYRQSYYYNVGDCF